LTRLGAQGQHVQQEVVRIISNTKLSTNASVCNANIARTKLR